MKNIPIYAALAQAFAVEGVDTHFTLMGDGNMHWAAAMKSLDGMCTFAARHEHCACAMAIGYHSATGKVGVASVTCGPGLTQITTALAVAARARIPLVVFAGEAPINAEWYNQAIEQPPFAAVAGEHYISAHSPERLYQYVREAFYSPAMNAGRSCFSVIINPTSMRVKTAWHRSSTTRCRSGASGMPLRWFGQV
jgi:acetolactate synthase-1/2/3 large subunit